MNIEKSDKSVIELNLQRNPTQPYGIYVRGGKQKSTIGICVTKIEKNSAAGINLILCEFW